MNKQRSGGVEGLTSFTPFLPGDAPGRSAGPSGDGQLSNAGLAVLQGFSPVVTEAGNRQATDVPFGGNALRSGAAEKTHAASFEQAHDGDASSSDSGSEKTSIDAGSLLQNRTLRRNAEQAWRESDPTGPADNRREVGFWGRGSYDKYGRVTKVEIGLFQFGKHGLTNNHLGAEKSPFSVRKGVREFLFRFHTHPYPLSHSIGPSPGGDHAPKGGFTIVRNRRGYCVMNEDRQTFGDGGACTP